MRDELAKNMRNVAMGKVAYEMFLKSDPETNAASPAISPLIAHLTS